MTFSPDFHELAQLFPMLDDVELAELADDIRRQGLLEAIVLYEGKILDGRNRYLACRDAGVEPEYEYFDGHNPLEYVISKNLYRRHLTSSQRAVIALDVLPELEAKARERQGTRTDLVANLPQGGKAREQAATIMQTSPRQVQDAKKIAEEAPELLPDIRAGKMTINKAKTKLRRAARVGRINEIAENNRPLESLPQQYPIIYADPPWQYEHTKTDNRHIENHYPTMTIEELCALPVAEIATPDAMLFLWATNPKLVEAMQVIDAWGFTYRTNLVWVKDKIGMGYYARQQHELLLVARRGNVPVPLPADRYSSVIEAPRGEHSEKPESVYEMLEAMYPEYARLELFARTRREGWAVWGNQAQAA